MEIEDKSVQSSFSVESSIRPPLKETCDRIVAFLDIMGFKDMVARQAESNIIDKLKKLNQFISDISEETGLIFSMFSDSIILFSGDNKDADFDSMTFVVGKIVEKSISLGLPIKGAMAQGNCTVNMGSKPFYFGQPIIDAYILEENVVLYGVVMHNTMEELSESALQRESKIVYDCAVPLKGGKSRHYLLNWFAENKDENMKNIMSIRRTVSDSPRRYIDNTLVCIDELIK